VGLRGGDISFNAVRVLVSLAYGLRDNKRDGEELREIYDFNIQGRPKPFEGYVNLEYQAHAGRPPGTGYLMDLIARMTVKET
jgi:hypothetical protein